MPRVLSVNLAVPRPTAVKRSGPTGIDKRPTDAPVDVRVPAKGSGLAGDAVCDHRYHGGPDQAVYAYAREDLDVWEVELRRDLRNGMFGENLTTSGVDVTGALIGERWRIGEDLLLEVSAPRIPCAKFAAWLAEQRWVKRVTVRAVPGTYLRVIEPGRVRAGDPITVVSRPDHDVTVGVTFRAMTREPELLGRLLDVEALPEKTREHARSRTG